MFGCNFLIAFILFPFSFHFSDQTINGVNGNNVGGIDKLYELVIGDANGTPSVFKVSYSGD